MKKQTTNCKKCGKNISNNNFEKHYNSCGNKKINLKFSSDWIINDNECKCPYCDTIFSKKGIITHILRSHTNPELFENSKNLTSITSKKDYIPWNKGLTKETDERVKKNGETFKNRIKTGEIELYWVGKKHSTESKNKIGLKLTKNNNGGRCKWFSFIKKNGSEVKLQGTWEVRFAKVLEIIDENWIKIGVGHKGHSYIWTDIKSVEHYYTRFL